MAHAKDYTKVDLGHWEALEDTGEVAKNTGHLWICRCKHCNHETIYRPADLKKHGVYAHLLLSLNIQRVSDWLLLVTSA